jgi:hypothetical protein
MWSSTIDEADRLGVACCLETSTEENRRFYERRGFEQAAEALAPNRYLKISKKSKNI